MNRAKAAFRKKRPYRLRTNSQIADLAIEPMQEIMTGVVSKSPRPSGDTALLHNERDNEKALDVETASSPTDVPPGETPNTADTGFHSFIMLITEIGSKKEGASSTLMDNGSLNSVLEEFRGNYERFANEHGAIRIEDRELALAIQAADVENNLRVAANTFERGIANVLHVSTETANSRCKVEKKVTKFLTKLYPLIRTSLALTRAVASVHSLNRIHL